MFKASRLTQKQNWYDVKKGVDKAHTNLLKTCVKNWPKNMWRQIKRQWDKTHIVQVSFFKSRFAFLIAILSRLLVWFSFLKLFDTWRSTVANRIRMCCVLSLLILFIYVVNHEIIWDYWNIVQIHRTCYIQMEFCSCESQHFLYFLKINID